MSVGYPLLKMEQRFYFDKLIALCLISSIFLLLNPLFKQCFFLLFNFSLIKKMKSSERDKNIRVLILGVVTSLHAVMFIGGSESLLYNLRSYFWILLALDIITNLLTREKLISDITKAFPVLKSSNDSYDSDDETGYRLIVPSANPEEELPNSNSKESKEDKNPINMEIREKPKKRRSLNLKVEKEKLHLVIR